MNESESKGLPGEEIGRFKETPSGKVEGASDPRLDRPQEKPEEKHGVFSDLHGPLAEMLNGLPIEEQKTVDAFILNLYDCVPKDVEQVTDPSKAQSIFRNMQRFLENRTALREKENKSGSPDPALESEHKAILRNIKKELLESF